MKNSATKKVPAKIGVTSVGGGVGQSLLKALYQFNCELVAFDASSEAAGLYAASQAYLLPYVKDPNYLTRLLKICRQEKIKLLFPGSDTELLTLAQAKDQFEKIGTSVVVSRPEVIRLADNKLQTARFLEKLGVPTPKTQSLANFLKAAEISYPIILKPKTGGSRSQGVYRCQKKSEILDLLDMQRVNLRNFVAQELIEGDEYTCGSINWAGECHGVVVMRRILRDGDTHKAFVEKRPEIEEMVKKIMNSLKPFGACNVQLRLKNGIPYVFEINARSSGTTGARALSGFNEPKLITEQLLYGKKPHFKVTEQIILRYWKEYVVAQTDFANLTKQKKRTANKFRRL